MASDHGQQSRLSAPRRSDDREELALPQIKIDRAERVQATSLGPAGAAQKILGDPAQARMSRNAIQSDAPPVR